MKIIQHLIDAAKGKHPFGVRRSSSWPAIRRAHLTLHPACANCGGMSRLQVHHIKPFHLNRDLELDQNNLVTLCESKKAGVNCHLWYGHLGNFKSWNENVVADVAAWFLKFTSRPK